jgi:hypothetical protein
LIPNPFFRCRKCMHLSSVFWWKLVLCVTKSTEYYCILCFYWKIRTILVLCLRDCLVLSDISLALAPKEYKLSFIANYKLVVWPLATSCFLCLPCFTTLFSADALFWHTGLVISEVSHISSDSKAAHAFPFLGMFFPQVCMTCTSPLIHWVSPRFLE